MSGCKIFCAGSHGVGSSDLSWNEWRNRFDIVRTAATIAASLIGLSAVGAFASGVYHRRPPAADSGAHTPTISVASEKRDNTLAGDSSTVGTYCPIPPRTGAGTAKGLKATSVGSAGDSLLLTGQSVAPDTAKACTGTAAPEKRP